MTNDQSPYSLNLSYIKWHWKQGNCSPLTSILVWSLGQMHNVLVSTLMHQLVSRNRKHLRSSKENISFTIQE